jgi:hypothetical protein
MRYIQVLLYVNKTCPNTESIFYCETARHRADDVIAA